MAAEQYLVRIPPQSPRNQHTIKTRTFKKSAGWVGPLVEGVDDDLIEALRAEPLNELHPDNSPKVFEVKLRKEAMQVHTKESKKKKPAGTPDKPNETPNATGRQKGRVGAGEAKAKAEAAKAKAETEKAESEAAKAESEAAKAKAEAAKAKAEAGKAKAEAAKSRVGAPRGDAPKDPSPTAGDR